MGDQVQEPPQIIIVDDHPALRAGLAGILITHGFQVVLQADGSRELFDYLRNESSPDAILLDLDLGEESGVDIMRFVSEHYPELAVVVLTHLTEMNLIRSLIDSGARGFISKKESGETIAVLLRSVIQGVSPVYSPIIQMFLHAISRRASPLDQLSQKELEVLRLIVGGYRYQDIASDLGVSRRTVEHHAQVIKEKLQAESLVDLVRIADEYLPK